MLSFSIKSKIVIYSYYYLITKAVEWQLPWSAQPVVFWSFQFLSTNHNLNDRKDSAYWRMPSGKQGPRINPFGATWVMGSHPPSSCKSLASRILEDTISRDMWKGFQVLFMILLLTVFIISSWAVHHIDSAVQRAEASADRITYGRIPRVVHTRSRHQTT